MENGLLEILPANREEKRKGKTALRFSLKERVAVLVAGDITFLLLSVVLAFWVWTALYHGPGFSMGFVVSHKSTFLLIAPWLFISMISDSYSTDGMRNLLRAIKQPVRTAVLVWLVYIIIYFFAPRGTLPRMLVVFFGLISCALLVPWRLAHFALFTRVSQRQRLLIIADEPEAVMLTGLAQKAGRFYEVMDSFICAAKCDDCCLHKIDEMDLDQIIFAAQKMLPEHCQSTLVKLRQSGVAITPMPIFYEQLTRRMPIELMQGWYLSYLPLKEAEWGGFYPIFKRIMDIIFALVGLLFFIELFPFLALAIKLDSSGPLFFSQIRVGKNGRRFKLWKLRTMTHNPKGAGAMWTEHGDNRITRVGRILRKIHLDELPQVVNLLKGDISVVGVRPLNVPQCKMFAREIPFHDLRHLVKPGMTSWAVVNYRHVNDLKGAIIRLEYDLYYVKYQSLWLDLYIIFRTVWTMVTMNGL